MVAFLRYHDTFVKLDTNRIQATARRKRAGIGARNGWGNARVGLF